MHVVIEKRGLALPGGIEFVVRVGSSRTYVVREHGSLDGSLGTDSDTLGWFWTDGELVHLTLNYRTGRRSIRKGPRSFVTNGAGWSVTSLRETVWRSGEPTDDTVESCTVTVRVGLRRIEVSSAKRVALGSAWPCSSRRKIVIRPSRADMAPFVVAMMIAEWRQLDLTHP